VHAWDLTLSETHAVYAKALCHEQSANTTTTHFATSMLWLYNSKSSHAAPVLGRDVELLGQHFW